VSGSFAYDPCVADADDRDPARGRYEHAAGGAFSLRVANRVVTGTGKPWVDVEDLSSDTFRWKDGAALPVGKRHAVLVDGNPDPAVQLFLAITDGSGAAFATDDLPARFPLLDIQRFPHTFFVEDAGGSLLMQLDTLTQP
jgi:hypothetical protein